MARLASNDPILKLLRGKLGKQLVFKQYGDTIVVTKYPKFRKKKRSPAQKANTTLFAQAVAFAQTILRDPKKYAAFKGKAKKGKTVYNTAISHFLRKKSSS